MIDKEKLDMTRRSFLSVASGTIAAGAVRSPVALAWPLTEAGSSAGASVKDIRMRDAGWVWEGQPAYRDFPPSIYGLGEGCRYFGLRRAYYLYHGNNRTALAKLSHLDQVICDISIWRYRKIQDDKGAIGWGIYHEKSPDIIKAEAGVVSELSLKFPNLFGAMLDDLYGAVKSQGYKRADLLAVHSALKSRNPNLKICSTVYTHELKPDNWEPFRDLIDVIFLWVWKSEDLFGLDEGVERCRKLFPDKPIVLGCYVCDFTMKTAVPMDRLKYQWERIPGYLASGKISGFCILGAYLIDRHPEQVEWIRDFIAQH